jgi:plastocyanin
MKTFTIMIVAFTTTILLAPVLQMTNSHASTTTSTIVQAGEATTPLLFSPQTVEINAGESVTWTNPTKVAEPHTNLFSITVRSQE